MNPCPLCSHPDPVAGLTCHDFFVSGEEFPVFRCPQCGFSWTGGAPRPGEIGRYYQSEDYISHSNTAQGFVNRMYHLVRSYMLNRKANLVSRVSGKKSGALLDIGAGTGYFLRTMQQRGWQVSGTEKSSKAREFCLSQWNIDLLPDEGLFALPDRSFDVITLWHVLEHLHEPDKYLKKAARLLKPSGCLVVALPNPGSYDARHYGRYWAAWDVPRHLWHFLPGNVEKLAGKQGFSPVKTYRMPFDAFYVSILSEKYKKSKFPVIKGIWHGTLSWVISLFSPRRCSSLIYLFRNQDTDFPSPPG